MSFLSLSRKFRIIQVLSSFHFSFHSFSSFSFHSISEILCLPTNFITLSLTRNSFIFCCNSLYNKKCVKKKCCQFSTISISEKIKTDETNDQLEKIDKGKNGDRNLATLEGNEKEALLQILSRYSSLRPTDRLKMVQMHMKNKNEIFQKKVLKWSEFRTQDLDEAMSIEKMKAENEILDKKKMDKIKNKLKPSYLRKKKIIAKRMLPTEEPKMPVISGSFNDETEELTLIEDCHKAEIYEDICRRLNNQWKEGKNILTDRFFDIMTSAIRHDLMDQSRPVLVNELSDFDNPFLLKRSTLHKLLIEKCARNCLDESLVDQYLEQRPDLIRLKLQAKMPPEVVEPLLAFRGDSRYHFDKRVRLHQKTDAIIVAVNSIINLDGDKNEKIKKVLEVLPENQRPDKINSSHPFGNHFGFSSAIPWGYSGSIKMGKPRKSIDEELDKIRYPTLQRVSHSLPKDPKYRASVMHAIKILERSRGWDFESKLKAINGMCEVYNNMASSKTYDKILDDALPIIRRRGMCRKTRSRQRVFNQGLTYIRSLTTNKPLHSRLQKKGKK